MHDIRIYIRSRRRFSLETSYTNCYGLSSLKRIISILLYLQIGLDIIVCSINYLTLVLVSEDKLIIFKKVDSQAENRTPIATVNFDMRASYANHYTTWDMHVRILDLKIYILLLFDNDQHDRFKVFFFFVFQIISNKLHSILLLP